MSFEDRLKDSAGDYESKTDKSIQELLYGHYPDLTEKEFAICNFDCLCDLGYRSTFFVIRLIHRGGPVLVYIFLEI